MFRIIEQTDGYRVDEEGELLGYFKKERGWSRMLVEEILGQINEVFVSETRAFDAGYQCAKEDLCKNNEES